MKFSKKTVTARNAAAPYPSLAERITVRAETQAKVYEEVKGKLDEIARPKEREKYLLKRAQRRPVTRPLPKAEQQRINEEYEQRLWALEQLSRLLVEEKIQKNLEDRMSNPKPSLLSRMGPPPRLTQQEVEEMYGDDDDMRGKVPKEAGRMQKSYIIDRTNEMMNLFKAVRLRLLPLGDRLADINDADEQLCDEVDKIFKDFDDLYDHFQENKGEKKLKAKHYRWIKRDLKKIKYVSFEKLSTRYLDIAKEIAALGISFEY